MEGLPTIVQHEKRLLCMAFEDFEKASDTVKVPYVVIKARDRDSWVLSENCLRHWLNV